ncbi:hypothetical protein CRM22_000571 [Opisthorchis felineus]|nr:hypothetical protein CRM22_000571 [Opisthorchis felineus]
MGCFKGFDSLRDKLWTRLSDVELYHLEIMYTIGYMESCKDKNANSFQHDPMILHHIGSRLNSLLTSSLGVLYPLLVSASEFWLLEASRMVSCGHLMETVQQVSMSVLLHWESEDRLVIKNMKKFLDALFSLEPAGVSGTFHDWMTETLIDEHILMGPLAVTGSVLLSKGRLHCLMPVLKFLGPVKLLQRCPYLTTSLLIAMGHNYTAATAADVLLQLVSMCTLDNVAKEPILTSHIIDPLTQYILYERLDCTSVQEAFGSVDTPIDTTRANRRINFACQCLRKDFATLLLPVLPSRELMTPENAEELVCPRKTLLEHILHALSLLMCSEKDLPTLRYHRHFLWLHFFNLHADKLSLLASKEDLTPLVNGLFHADDYLRAVAFSGLVNLARAVLTSPSQLRVDIARVLTDPDSYTLFFLLGIILLNGSTNPVARKYLVTSFNELLRGIRNACASVDVKSVTSFPRRLSSAPKSVLLEASLTDLFKCVQFGLSGILPSSVMPALQRKTISVNWLCYLIQFFSPLWSKLPSFEFSAEIPSPLHHQNAFWPGMTYQRMKVNVELMYTIIGLLNLNESESDVYGQWRTGYTSASLLNIRRLVEKLACDFCWDYKSPAMLHSLLDSLRLLKPDLQPQLLDLVTMTWHDISSVLTDDQCATLLASALRWCDSFNVVEYSAGGNLLLYWYTHGCAKTVELQVAFNEAFHRKLVSLSNAELHGQLLTIAKHEPGIGYLVALDQLFATLLPNHAVAEDSLINSVELIELCLRLSNLCLTTMGCDPWSPSAQNTDVASKPQKGASSFRELGESILRVALGEQTDKGRPTGGQQRSELDSENDVDLIRLLPEYQHILSWSWNSLRYSASILSRWAVLHAGDAEPHVRNLCTQIGYQLVHILLHCRHRGTVEAVCVSLQHYLSTAQRLQETNNSISLVSCEQVLNLCWTVLCHYGYSVTRRAAGLWPAVKAALLAEQARKDQRVPVLLIRWLTQLIDLARHNPGESHTGTTTEEMTDSPRALALHLLRGIFCDSRLRPHLQPVPEMIYSNFLIHALEFAVLPTFSDSDWTVSNAGLQLHSALVLRLTGTNSGRAPSTSIEIFGKYTTLLELCLRELEMAAKLQISRPSRTTQVIPILTLFGRLSPGAWTDSQLNKRARSTICHFLLHHNSSAIREMAARAYLVFLPLMDQSGNLDSSLELSRVGPLQLLKSESNRFRSEPFTANAIHGQLCLLRAWLTQPVSCHVLQNRKSSFHWDNALTYLDRLMTTRSPGAFILAHHLCNLMSLAVDPDNSPCVRTRFLSWLSTNNVRLLSATITPFHLEAILTLHLLAHRICGEFPHLDVTLSPDVTPTVLHRLLCIAEDSDIGGWVPNLLNYWTQRTELHRTHPMLCWRIVEVWSSVLSAHSTTESPTLTHALTDISVLPMLKHLLDDGCDSIHQSMALLCAAACFCDQLNSSCLPEYRSPPQWWLHTLSDCLSPACPESARIIAGEAILIWNERLCHQPSAALFSDTEQCRFFIKTLFFALFDACNEVRTKIGCFIHQRLCNMPTKYLQQPVCHLISVLRLLDNMLPSWLPFPESQLMCLYDIWWGIMDDLIERISEESFMRKRQALYEREVDNDFCEPRLLFQFLFERLLRTDFKILKHHKQVLDDVIARAHGRISVLEPLCSMSSASTSPSVHAWNVGMSFLADLRANLSVDSPDIPM